MRQTIKQPIYTIKHKSSYKLLASLYAQDSYLVLQPRSCSFKYSQSYSQYTWIKLSNTLSMKNYKLHNIQSNKCIACY